MGAASRTKLLARRRSLPHATDGEEEDGPAVIRPGTSDAAPIPLFRIFVAFARVGLVSVGGGGSAHVHREIVERRGWIDEVRFVEAVTVTRILPGTNVSNLASFIGASLRGPAGAACAAAGVVLPGAMLVVLAAAASARASFLHTPAGLGVLRGLAAGALGVSASLVWHNARAGLRGGLRSALLALTALVPVAFFRVNVAYVLALLVPLAALVTPRRQDA